VDKPAADRAVSSRQADPLIGLLFFLVRGDRKAARTGLFSFRCATGPARCSHHTTLCGTGHLRCSRSPGDWSLEWRMVMERRLIARMTESAVNKG
jgi:hypothetical protein